jgi:histidinol phosphatase-like enzyme
LIFPGHVKLYSVAAENINKFWFAGFKIIIVINQPDIGRGIFMGKNLR